MGLRELTIDKALTKAFRVSVESSQTREWMSKLVQRLNSDQPEETYRLLLAIPGFREWIGPILFESLSTQVKTIPNVDWYAALTVHRDDWDFKKFGVLEPAIAELASQGIEHQFDLVTKRIVNGHTEVAIDGANFFSTTHSTGASGTNSNLVSVNLNSLPAQVRGTGTNPSTEEAARLMQYAARVIMGIKNNQGRPQSIGASSFLVMVPLKYMDSFLGAESNTTFEYGMQNPLLGKGLSFQVIVNPLLPEGTGESFETSIAIFRVDSPLKPFALQERRPISSDILGPDSEHAVTNPNYLFKAEWTGNSANMFWWNAAKITMTRS